jgi:hypothetical protein
MLHTTSHEFKIKIETTKTKSVSFLLDSFWTSHLNPTNVTYTMASSPTKSSSITDGDIASLLFGGDNSYAQLVEQSFNDDQAKSLAQFDFGSVELSSCYFFKEHGDNLHKHELLFQHLVSVAPSSYFNHMKLLPENLQFDHCCAIVASINPSLFEKFCSEQAWNIPDSSIHSLKKIESLSCKRGWDVRTALADDLQNLFVSESVDPSRNSVAYGKFVTGAVDSHCKGLSDIIKNANGCFTSAEIARATFFLDSFKDLPSNDKLTLWYVGETICSFDDRMIEEYPETIKALSNVAGCELSQGVIGVTPMKSKKFALILEGAIAGMIQSSENGPNSMAHFKESGNFNIALCGERKWTHAGGKAMLHWCWQYSDDLNDVDILTDVHRLPEFMVGFVENVTNFFLFSTVWNPRWA